MKKTLTTILLIVLLAVIGYIVYQKTVTSSNTSVVNMPSSQNTTGEVAQPNTEESSLTGEQVDQTTPAVTTGGDEINDISQ